MRAAIDTDCLAWMAPEMMTTAGNTARAVIRVTGRGPSANKRQQLPLPADADWPASSLGTCYDVNSTVLAPRMEVPPMNDVKGRVFFNITFGTVILSQPTASEQRVLGRFFVDNTTYTSRPQQPLLDHMLQGGQGFLNSSEVAYETLRTDGVWDIVMNNLDAALEHPFHLHGMDSCLVASGEGPLNDALANNLHYNTRTPVCRDVHVIPANTYAVFRVHAFNPGVWFFHCHMGWHLAMGFAGAVVVQPEVLKRMQLPAPNRALCQV